MLNWNHSFITAFATVWALLIWGFLDVLRNIWPREAGFISPQWMFRFPFYLQGISLLSWQSWQSWAFSTGWFCSQSFCPSSDRTPRSVITQGIMYPSQATRTLFIPGSLFVEIFRYLNITVYFLSKHFDDFGFFLLNGIVWGMSYRICFGVLNQPGGLRPVVLYQWSIFHSRWISGLENK